MKEHPIGGSTPQSIETEEEILAALLIEGERIDDISSLITEEFFYKKEHQIIFRAIIEVKELGFKPDLMNVTQELREKNLIADVGGAYFISTIVNKVTTAENLTFNIKILTQKYIAREFILLLSESNNKTSKNENPYKIYKNLSEKLDKLFTIEDEAQQFKNIIDETIENLKDIISGKYKSRLYSRTSFDKIIDISRDETIWIAALSKHGKTKTIIYFMSQLLKNNEDISVKWLTMEDPTFKVVRHFAAIETKIEISKMERKDENIKLNEDELKIIENKLEKIKKYDISLEYGTKTVEYVSTQALTFIKKRKEKHNIIIIDNFNMLVDNVEGRMTDNQKENHVTKKLQQLRIKTNENGYNTTLIVLDHLNKEIFKDGLEKGYRPSEGLLKGSSRKQEAMTQLLFVNKVGRYNDLVEQYIGLPKVKLGNKEFEVTDILDKLILYETILTRNGGVETGKPIRYLTNLDTMEFKDFEELKKETEKSEEIIHPSPEPQMFKKDEQINTKTVITGEAPF